MGPKSMRIRVRAGGLPPPCIPLKGLRPQPAFGANYRGLRFIGVLHIILYCIFCYIAYYILYYIILRIQNCELPSSDMAGDMAGDRGGQTWGPSMNESMLHFFCVK